MTTNIENGKIILLRILELNNQIKSIELVRDEMRNKLSEIVAEAGVIDVEGVGKAIITKPSVIIGYDKSKIERLITEFATSNPEIATKIIQCRTESVRTGSLRIEECKK